MDFNKLVARANAILMSPATEWPVIADEPATVSEIFKNYVVWLAAISAIAGLIANTIVGYNVPFLGHYRMGFAAGLTGAVTTYVLSLAGVFLVAYLADVLAPSFGGQKNFTQAVKAVAYAYTAAWIAGVGFIVPGLRWLITLAGLIYSIYLLRLGLLYTMKCPPEKAWPYTAVTIIAAIIVQWLVGIVAADIGGVGYAAYGPRAASSSGTFDSGGFDPGTPGGKLEHWVQGMEAASQKMDAAQKRGDSAAASHAAGAMIGAALGGDGTVQALAPDRLREFLPGSLGGLARSQTSAERHAVLGIQSSQAEAQYSDNAGHSIKLQIQDSGGANALVSLVSWASVEEDKQTASGYEKTYKTGDHMVHEQWNQPAGQSGTGYGEYAVIVGQRYNVQASGRVANIDMLKSAVASVDLAKLESLRNEGVRAN
jgi:hypothetical protein